MRHIERVAARAQILQAQQRFRSQSESSQVHRQLMADTEKLSFVSVPSPCQVSGEDDHSLLVSGSIWRSKGAPRC